MLSRKLMATATLLKPDPGYDWRCQRCNHQWRSRHPNEDPPTSCSKCRSAYWQKPRKDKQEAEDTRKDQHRAHARKTHTDVYKGARDPATAKRQLAEQEFPAQIPPPPHLRQPDPDPTWEDEEIVEEIIISEPSHDVE